MSNICQSESSNTNAIGNWDEAIARTETELSKMQRYVTRLKAAKRVFLDSKERGLVWPGSIEAMMDEFKAGVAGQKKTPRHGARAVA